MKTFVKKAARYSVTLAHGMLPAILTVVGVLCLSAESHAQYICRILPCSNGNTLLIVSPHCNSFGGCIIWDCDDTMIEVPNGLNINLSKGAARLEPDDTFALNALMAVSHLKLISPPMQTMIKDVKKVILKHRNLVESSARRELVVDKAAKRVSIALDDVTLPVPLSAELFTLEEMLATGTVERGRKIGSLPNNNR